MKDLIRQVLREELTSTQEKLVRLTQSLGISKAADFVGGIDRYINILYGGDFEKFVKENGIQVVRFSNDGLNMYIHPVLANLLGAKDKKFLGADYLNLGKFRYGTQGTNGRGYSFNAELQPMKQNGEVINYKVVGTSGDSGFGYSFINQRNTLGKRARQQIFQQIIDKYNLQKYINEGLN